MKSKIIVALICLVLFASTVSVVHADGDAASLWTSDDNNSSHHQNEFSPGQTVYIFWSPVESTQHVCVYDINSYLLEDFGLISSQPAQWQIPNDAAAGTLYWIIIPGVGPYPISVATVHVLPESPWGSIVAVSAGFAAFGAFSVYRTRRKKPL